MKIAVPGVVAVFARLSGSWRHSLIRGGLKFGERMLDQRTREFRRVQHVHQHALPWLEGARSTVFVGGLEDSAQELAGVGLRVGR
ncbi:hypothetical protein G7009_19950 [Pseudomonas capeferrum]|uniref:hypothetical protein n=1 Tax=Pseudomonas capeferrum TaxID=1495066 RepID=UPI0015E44D30|nr:hypothetical protein [Pseudomonas capeferrum]MBA1203996.1 hypothetical protein [Pseudomonas capeferrum]